MKIAVISDLHDNLQYLNKFLGWSQRNRVDEIICCGDMTNNDSIDCLAEKFSGKIYIARGNADSFESTAKNIFELGRLGKIIETGGISIGICHEPRNIQRLASSFPDYIFYGHTHKPHLEKSGMTIIANPGTLGGWQYPSSFASLDTETMNLQLIVTDEIK